MKTGKIRIYIKFTLRDHHDILWFIFLDTQSKFIYSVVED
jgi:hypothetical protein